MFYSALGWLHAYAATLWERSRDQRGQGTVEYVGVVVLITLIAAAVAVASKSWAPQIGNSLKDALLNALKKVTAGF